jgi:hypothetical protein
MSSRPNIFAAPLGSAERGHLEFARGAARVTIAAGAEPDDLASARFDGSMPMVFADDGRLTIEYPRVSPSDWLHPSRRAAEVALNPSIPWELVFSGGVAKLRGDLGDLQVRGLEIRRGANDVRIDLPAPVGVVPIRIGGGASKVTLRRPAGTAVIVAVEGGTSKLEFDDERHGSLGGPTRLASPGATEAVNRYEIEIGGGASQLSIAEELVPE